MKKKKKKPPHISVSNPIQGRKGTWPFRVGVGGSKRTFLVRVQRYHVPLEVLGAGKTFRAARHGADVRAFPRLIGLGHPATSTFLDQMRDGDDGG